MIVNEEKWDVKQVSDMANSISLKLAKTYPDLWVNTPLELLAMSQGVDDSENNVARETHGDIPMDICKPELNDVFKEKCKEILLSNSVGEALIGGNIISQASSGGQVIVVVVKATNWKMVYKVIHLMEEELYN